MGAALLILNKLSTLFNVKIKVKFEKHVVALCASAPFKPSQLNSCLVAQISSKKLTHSD